MEVKRAILIIEDDPWVAEYMADVIKTLLGIETLVATTAQAARILWRANEESIRVVLCDVTLPGVSGEMLMAELAGDRPEIPVVFATGHAREAEELSQALGRPVDVLLKPFRPAELVSILETRLHATREAHAF